MEVIVYSQRNCGYCTEQKEFLKEKGIAFEERDIRESGVFLNEYIELGGTGTPFTIKKENGEIVSKILGFNKKNLLKELS